MQSLLAFATSVVDRARAAGATAADVYVRHGLETEIQVRNGEIETLQEGSPRSVGLRLWVGDRSASTYATDFGDAAISRLIADTLELAELTDPEPEAALPDAALMVREVADLDLWDERLAHFTAAEKLDLARSTEAAAIGTDPRITASAGASYGDLVMTHAIANSHGVAHVYRESYAHFAVEVVADDAGGKKRNGSHYSVARHLADLKAADEVGVIAGQRAVAQLGAGPLPTRRLPVVFDPRAGAGIVGLLFSVLTGGAIERRASYLVDRLGERVASELVSLVDDPTLVRAPGSRPFDGELLPARRTAFIEGGILRSYALNCYSARKLGLQPTGHASRGVTGRPGEGPSNLFLAPGAATPAELVGSVEYGFYCDATMGFGFNAATGDFSRGASGFLIENGQLTRPVSEVTLSANFADLLDGIDAIANDLDHSRSICAPTFRVAQMTLAGTAAEG
jgi:PmbA protein